MLFTKNINQTLVIDTPVAKVWQALTDPEIIKQWLWDNEIKVISDWKVNSPILFKGKFHDMDFTSKGTILEFEKESVLEYTYWSPISEIADIPGNYHTIEFILIAQGDKTEVALNITNLINDTIYGHMNFYWHTTLAVLKKLLEK